LPRVGTAEIFALYAVQPARASPLKSTAPRKRSMVAWRRRPIPRVMQCPRQDFVLAGWKKVQRHPRWFAGQFAWWNGTYSWRVG